MDCSSVISNATLADCAKCGGRQQNVLVESVGCQSTCADLARLCNILCTSQSLSSKLGDMFDEDVFVYLSIIGIFSNMCVFIALLSKSLSGTTFVFLRFIALVQVCQALFGILQTKYYYLADGLARSITQQVLYAATPGIKLTACMATFFLTLERFLAVVYTNYQHMNITRYTIFSFIISILVGSLELLCLPQFGITLTVSKNVTKYSFKTFHTFFDQGIIYVIVCIKILSIILMLAFTAVIIQRLWARSKKVAELVSTETAKRKHQEIVGLCRFQMIDTVVVALDTLISVSANVVPILSSSRNRVNSCYSDYAYDSVMRTVDNFMNVICDTNLSCAHFELFFIYLIFFGTFRRAFVSVVRNFAFGARYCWRKKVSPAVSMAGSGVHGLSLHVKPWSRAERSRSVRPSEAVIHVK